MQRALSTANEKDRASLIAKVENIAHILAGTAAMFGELRLGELASAVEDRLRSEAENSAAGIADLVQALRRAA